MSDENTLEANPIDFSSIKNEKKPGFLHNLFNGIMKTQRAKNQAKMNTLDNMASGLTAAHNAFMNTDLTAAEGGKLANDLGKKADKILGTTPSEEKPKNPSEKPSEKLVENDHLFIRTTRIPLIGNILLVNNY